MNSGVVSEEIEAQARAARVQKLVEYLESLPSEVFEIVACYYQEL